MAIYFTAQTAVDGLVVSDSDTIVELLELVRKMSLELTRLANEQEKVKAVEKELANEQEKMKAVKEELFATKEELLEARTELLTRTEEFLAIKEELFKTQKELISTQWELHNRIKDLEVATELLKGKGKKLTTVSRSGGKVKRHTFSLKEGAIGHRSSDSNTASNNTHVNRSNLDRNDRMRRSTSTNVGFTARLTNAITSSLNTHQILVFDDVYINVGNGYNAATGVFHAPVEGMYVILVSISSNGGPVSGDVEVVQNGLTVCRAVAPHNTYGGSPCTAVVHLAVGDAVWVREYLHHGSFDQIRGDKFTTFSMGLILKGDATSS